MASLQESNLGEANLSETDVRGSILDDADLRGADLRGADFRGASLLRTELGKAKCWRSVFADIDLSESKGLESVDHLGPSLIGTDTLIRSRGKIPEAFLRGCGLPTPGSSTYLP